MLKIVITNYRTKGCDSKISWLVFFGDIHNKNNNINEDTTIIIFVISNTNNI